MSSFACQVQWDLPVILGCHISTARGSENLFEFNMIVRGPLTGELDVQIKIRDGRLGVEPNPKSGSWFGRPKPGAEPDPNLGWMHNVARKLSTVGKRCYDLSEWLLTSPVSETTASGLQARAPSRVELTDNLLH